MGDYKCKVGTVMGFLRECWRWIEAISWEHLAKIAPIFTALIALVAATVAICALRTQVSIARKRAAIDVFLKTEMDKGMLDAYREYERALEVSKQYPTVAEFVEADYDKYMAVRVYLDANKLICIGINQKAFDQRVCYGFWANILEKAATEGMPIIQYARQRNADGHHYDHILKVTERWNKPARFWHRWRK
jgi:hypothetical protein